MTDKQFNAFLRLLINSVERIVAANTAEEKDIIAGELIPELREDIEDTSCGE